MSVFQFYSDSSVIGTSGNAVFTVPDATLMNATGIQYNIENLSWASPGPAQIEVIIRYSGDVLLSRIGTEPIMFGTANFGIVTLASGMTITVYNRSTVNTANIKVTLSILDTLVQNSSQNYVSDTDLMTVGANTLIGIRPDQTTSQTYYNPMKALTSGYLYTYADTVDIDNYSLVSTLVPVTSYLKLGYATGTPTVADGNKISINTSAITRFAIVPETGCYGPNKNNGWILRANVSISSGTLQILYGSLGLSLSPTAIIIQETVPDPLSWWLVTSASVTAGALTITLFGVSFTVNLTVNSSAAAIANQLSDAINASSNSGAVTCSIGAYIFFRGIWQQLTSGSSSYSSSTGFTATIIGNLNNNTGLSPTSYLATNQLPAFATSPSTSAYSVQLESRPNEYVVSVNSANGNPFTPIHRINRTNNNFGFDGTLAIYGTGTVVADVFNVDLYKKNVSNPVMRTGSLLTYNDTTHATSGNTKVIFAFVKTNNWITTELTQLVVYSSSSRVVNIIVSINPVVASAITMAQNTTVKSGTIYTNTTNVNVPSFAANTIITSVMANSNAVTTIDLGLKFGVNNTYIVSMSPDPAAGSNTGRIIITAGINEYY